MYPLLFTTAFLMILSLFTSTQILEMKESGFQQKLYKSHLASTQQMAAEEAAAKFEIFVGEAAEVDGDDKVIYGQTGEKEAHIGSLKLVGKRPANNARLNLYTVLHLPDLKLFPPTFSLKETAARLMRRLYGGHDFFESVPQAEYRILDALNALGEQTKNLRFTDELTTCDLGDERLQAILYEMIQGSSLLDGYPSLCDYVCFNPVSKGAHNRKKINLLYADKELLACLLPNRSVVNIVIQYRKQLLERLKEQERDRKKIKKEDGLGRREVERLVKNDLRVILEKEGLNFDYYRRIFDCSLGQKGTLIHILDPTTQMTIHKKHKAS